jgi:hypothetical protein
LHAPIMSTTRTRYSTTLLVSPDSLVEPIGTGGAPPIPSPSSAVQGNLHSPPLGKSANNLRVEWAGSGLEENLLDKSSSCLLRVQPRLRPQLRPYVQENGSNSTVMIEPSYPQPSNTRGRRSRKNLTLIQIGLVIYM